MRTIEFTTVSGEATTGNSASATSVIEPADVDRFVQLVQDDSNWNLERADSKKTAAGTRAKIPWTGLCEFWLPAKKGLYIYARLATGGAGSVWSLSVTIQSEIGG